MSYAYVTPAILIRCDGTWTIVYEAVQRGLVPVGVR